VKEAWAWEPLVSVGPIVFGAGAETLTAVGGMRLEELKRSDGQLWSHYWSEEEGVGVMCVDQRIVSVACHETFCFQGANLVGQTEATVRMRFRDQPIRTGEFPDGYTLEIAALGLELTITKGTVLIASAFDSPLVRSEPAP
jgi:hypothetical protein